MDREEVLKKIRQAKEQRLTELDLSNHSNATNGEKLTEIPAEVFELEWLKLLKLRCNLIKTISQKIITLKNLSFLDLSRNQLLTIPKAIFSLQNLSKLNLRSNRIEILNETIDQLQNLSVLDLSYNRIISLNKTVDQLQNLSVLDLSYNQLTSIPKAIGHLQHLSVLDLKNNNLTSIPETIGSLHNLSVLDLRNNQITSIPEAIGSLHNLSQLNLSNNRLTSIPETIGSLQNLFAIYLSYNELKSIPETIANIQKLSKLGLDDNPLETPPIEIAVRGIDDIKKYFIQLKAEGKAYLYEAKLLIVGEGGAGKTSLAKKIKDLNYPVPNFEQSTEGIDIVEWHFPIETGQDFRTNIWDFGGQEIYNATHRFFLTKRSLYVLIADERKENTLFDYWLNIIELLSNNSPLLIIKNERDDRKREINITKLKGRFGNIKDDFATNLATNRGLPDILKAIKYHITSLPHIGSALPKTWTTVRERLEKDARNYIPLKEYLTICQNNGFKKLGDKLQLSQFLHDIGVILHFQDDKRSLLYKTVILKPEWGTDAVYKVLDSKTVVNNFGTFTNNDLDKIWEEEKYTNMQGELLELMMKFQLCYQLPDTDNKYIAPQLLEDKQPDYEWDETNNLILRYTYDFMPKGILTQFIVIMHSYIEQQQYVWKSGVILKKGEARAEVVENYNHQEIKIRLSGTNQRDFLGNITWELDRIHESYNRLKVKKLIPCNCSVCKNSQTPYFYEFDKLQERIVNKKQTIECGEPPYNTVSVKGLIDDVTGRNEPEKNKQQQGQAYNVNINGPVDKVVIQQSDKGNNIMEEKSKSQIVAKSSWANGLFYLFVFIVVVYSLGFFAGELPFYTLCIIVIAGILFIPIIGAFQLIQDKRITEKSFLKLMKMVIGQLPLIGNILGNFLNPNKP